MLLVAWDDTDSPAGGCTTALAAPMLARFSQLAPDGAPRLVRLNPNIPWKTRGNAAVALRFRGDMDPHLALREARALVDEAAQRHEGTDPGVVVAQEPLPPWLYDAAVSRVVEREEVIPLLEKTGARYHGGRGIIGAAAALAWPAQRATWERIAYRTPARMGTQRAVDDAWVREVEWQYATTFDSYDLVNGEVVCVPSGPDPVLWGIRGEDPDELERASAVLGPERPARETLFLTNQGTDDHLRERRASECRDMESVRVRARIAGAPLDRNGTVLFEIADGTGALRCAAYPPTRAFRQKARALDAGDDVTVCGGLHLGPDGRLTLGLEKMQVHATAPRRAGAPTCPTCGRSMKSAGKDAGYRCRECHTRADEARTAESIVQPGWHEVPASARRHLAMPLKRGFPRG